MPANCIKTQNKCTLAYINTCIFLASEDASAFVILNVIAIIMYNIELYNLYNMYWIRDSKVSGKKPALMMVVILKVYILFYLTIVMFFQ